MTNSISNTQNTLSIQSKQQDNQLRVLVEMVNRSIIRMKKRHIQLNQIINEHFDVIIRMEAEEHLVKQNKMLSIGNELFSRINSTAQLSNNYESVSEELIQQYLDEMDILNFMDFEVTKKYFSFIHDHYQPIVIQIRPMMAA